MRLKEDSSSWKSNGIKKRDFRHIHDEPKPAHRSKKDTRKYCYGKVGKEHILYRFVHAWVRDYGFWWPNTIQAKCTRCGKQFYGGKIVTNSKTPLHIIPDYEHSFYEIEVRH